TSAIVQVLLRLGSHAPLEAVSAPRLHCSVRGRVSLEAARFRDDIPPALAKRGFTVDVRDPHSFYLGCVQMVMRDKDTFIGVADPRRDGSAAGPKK
ncbi:MAG: gamma-glutamyltransferase family protein, partial [Proteobacteria bacterium]|nr:gamma-glutamyltransferase family protein [Pseudomonadota bacterium]